jgi:hypothetical protein
MLSASKPSLKFSSPLPNCKVTSRRAQRSKVRPSTLPGKLKALRTRAAANQSPLLREARDKTVAAALNRAGKLCSPMWICLIGAKDVSAHVAAAKVVKAVISII